MPVGNKAFSNKVGGLKPTPLLKKDSDAGAFLWIS